MSEDLEVRTSKRVLLNVNDVLERNENIEKYDVLVSYKAMNSQEINNKMSQNTHVAVSDFLRQMKALTVVSKETLEDLLVNDMLLEGDSQNSKVESDNYIINGGKNKLIQKRKSRDLLHWFEKTIKNESVINDLKIDINFVQRILIKADQALTWMTKAISGYEYKKKDVINLTILQLPSTDNEYFQLYYIHLFAFMDTTRDLFVLDDKHGLCLSFVMKQFFPRITTIDMVSSETKKTLEQYSKNFYMASHLKSETKHERDANNWPRVAVADGYLPSVLTLTESSKTALDKFNMTEEGQSPLKSPLAVSFDDVDKESILKMADNSLVAIAGVLRILRKLSSPYSDLLEEMQSNFLIETKFKNIYSDVFYKEYKEGKLNEISDDFLRGQLYFYLHKLIQDKEIRDDLKVVQESSYLLTAIKSIGDKFNVLKKITGKTTYFKRDIVDINVLRFPGVSRNFFHYYEFKLFAYGEEIANIAESVEKGGLHGTLTEYKFVPRLSIIQKLNKETIIKAIKESKTFFGIHTENIEPA